MLSTQTILLLLFSSVTDCRQILINLEMLRDTFSSTLLYDFMVDRDIHCFIALTPSLFVCHQRCDLLRDSLWLKPDSDNVSFPGHSLRECSFSPPPIEKLQDTAIKVSTSTTYWNSFPALCPTLSGEDAGSWRSVFVYGNQSCMCLSEAFYCPCVDKPVVNVFHYSKKIMLFSDNGHSPLHLNTVVLLVCLVDDLSHQRNQVLSSQHYQKIMTFSNLLNNSRHFSCADCRSYGSTVRKQ